MKELRHSELIGAQKYINDIEAINHYIAIKQKTENINLIEWSFKLINTRI